MMHVLSTAVAPEVAEVNSWHTLLAIFIAAFVLLAIWAIRTTFLDNEGEEEEAPVPFTAAPKTAPAPVAVPASDDALIAVITAAVAAAMQEENGGAAPAFRVVSFRKIS